MISLEKLKQIFEQHFSPPFLPEGDVKAEFVYVRSLDETHLRVTIGRRDIEIDEDGNLHACGTLLTGGK